MAPRPDNAHLNRPVVRLPRPWPFNLGGVAGLTLLVLFLVGAIAIVSTASNPTGTNGWIAPIQSNWLVTLFKVNVPASGVTSAALTVLNPLDLGIMLLFSMLSFTLNYALRDTSRAWSLVALSMPLLGIPVFLATDTAGRSALLVSAFVFSIVMIRSDIFYRPTAYVGLAASALLFLGGDIATAVFHPSSAIAGLLAIGYVLWVIWLLLITVRVFQLAGNQRSPP